MMQGESHRLDRVGWLRAAVLGANDGLVSTASLVVGVAAASPAPGAVLLAGIAGLTAGALSMAAGEFVSVSSQADLEMAEIARETAELVATPAAELVELAGIYRARGLSRELAMEVARELTAKDALGAHLRDELGITEVSSARPLQAALASAASFAAGGLPPILLALLAPPDVVLVAVGGATVLGLAALGWLAAWAGGAPAGRSIMRVMLWGLIAMGVTAAVGAWVGRAV
ncbi:VIT1/CCC1 transporter family protein [Sediminicoccus sp. KRV36]|uniref:VIT1/CCC1 transporter family protein n=1 Tax=Sediminicoccus sp. KRV36 TaxID=3133721 RepID=UPI00200ECB5A|nr:VIT1/CCC1 transporter family protein [Sediminicoccus rosea]UPY36872.1 VIT1/CCC1 transporter family protein [Sediminicoccus rosea]